MGYNVKEAVNPVVRGAVEYVAPTVKEAVCDQGGYWAVAALRAALAYAGY